MRVLDLFSGTGGWSEAFLQRGHEVVRVDNDLRFESVPNTLVMSVMDEGWPLNATHDVVLASPPCQCFSLSSIRHHFIARSTCRDCGKGMVRMTGERWVPSNCVSDGTLHLEPRSEAAVTSLALLDRTFELLHDLRPRYWWMENPRAGMKHFIDPQMPIGDFSKTTVTYCQYGDTVMKPTNLWGVWPDTWTPRPHCRNGDPCHEAAPRGSRTGTQGKADAAERGAIPYQLSLDVCLAVEAAEALRMSSA